MKPQIPTILILLTACTGWAQHPVDTWTDKDCLGACYAKLGAGGGGANPRNLAYGIAERGWQPVLDEHEGYLKRHGAAGLFVHNPWGHDGVWPMEWDQRPLAREHASLDKADATFIPAFRKFLTDNPNVKIVWYLGMADYSPAMQKLESNPEAWRERWQFSIAPIKQLTDEFPRRFTILTDSGSDLREGGLHYRAIRGLEAVGIRQGVELRPVRGCEHLRDLDVYLSFGLDINGPRDPITDAKERAKRYTDEELSGVKYCAMSYQTSTIANIRTVLKRGAVPIVTMQKFKP